MSIEPKKKKRNKKDDTDRKPDNSNILNVRQKLVLETMIMQRNTTQSLEYLKDVGYQITDRTLRRDKRKINELKLKRLYHIAKIGFEDQHIQKIDKLNMIEKFMWDKYKKCKDPFKCILILEKIANLQPIIAAFLDSTRYVLERKYPNIYNEEYDNEEIQS